MLKQRIMTAVILFPFIVAAILLLADDFFAIFWALIMSVTAYEWLKLSGIGSKAGLLLGVVVLNALFAFIWFYPIPDFPVEWLVLFAWLLIVFCFKGDPVARLKRYSANVYSSIGVVTGLIVVFPTWLAMIVLHQQNPWMVLYVFGIVWVADIGAYFSGKRFGKNKLAPAISPGKSWEGVYGALFATMIYSSVASQFLVFDGKQWLFVTISLVAAMASVAGDLLESVFKRAHGVKDSGIILPGHGGAMDRLDSIMAAAPVFTAMYYLAGWL